MIYVVFSWSYKSSINYKKSPSTNQIQYQFDEPISISQIPDKLADDPLMKPEYDDGMT